MAALCSNESLRIYVSNARQLVCRQKPLTLVHEKSEWFRSSEAVAAMLLLALPWRPREILSKVP